MQKFNPEKLKEYTKKLKLLPLNIENKKYKKTLAVKVLLLLGLMLFDFVVLCYLFNIVLHTFIAIVLAYVTQHYLYKYDLNFYTEFYKFLFKNDKKMMECLDD